MHKIKGVASLKEFLSLLGFKAMEGENDVWGKEYKQHSNYSIKISLCEAGYKKSQIDYGSDIIVHRKTTSNLSQNENLVVLECINRLLEKGYSPASIELEKQWTLGHKGKGFLDILVKDEDEKSFLMIECKNWETDYEKEIRNTLKNGGQLFSYLHQEPKTKAVSLYASKQDNNEIKFKNHIIYNKEDWIDKNQDERFQRWNKTFEDNGIFEEWTKPYFPKTKSITRGQLEKLDKEDGDNIYNHFAEILRHNVISDKSNAFNKIINLFLCKIYDEDRSETEEVKFQTRIGTRLKTDEELLSDLADLYKNGMQHYLEKTITDYTIDELETALKFNDKNILMDIYRKLRLYNDNVFAFGEVFDEKSFKENAKVVREIVELLEKKQLRYTHKQQFLGDFFEKLLKDSIKQEAGQFFTPVPITQFIIKSLPIRNIIEDKIERKEEHILPYTIDYACGAGHFLTEIMDALQKIIRNDIDIKKLKPSIKKDVESWKVKDFVWANEYIYGIDLDYRLVKTSKISAFLNGDGLAQIIHANGLDNFKNSETYRDILKTKKQSKDNQKFELLISNPPYSVKAFKNSLHDGGESFDLFDSLTDQSSEIECLFIERTKQLVKENGVVGIILPVSILTNGGLYEKSREMILKYFDIKGIVSLGSNAFMATGTKTIILFMQRRDNFTWERVKNTIDDFVNNLRDVACNDIEKAFSTYVKEIYEDLSFKDYTSILEGNPTDKAKKSEIFNEYQKTGCSFGKIQEIEKEKLLYFMLSYPQKIVIGKSGEKQAEKEFYGYEFSNRRGHEGIHIYEDESGVLQSKLYGEDIKDAEKLNSYILKSFTGEKLDGDIKDIQENETHPLKEHIEYARITDLMTFDRVDFDKQINLQTKKKIKIESKYPLVKLGDEEYFDIKVGGDVPEGASKNKTKENRIPIYANASSNDGLFGYTNKARINNECITIAARGTIGFIKHRNEKFYPAVRLLVISPQTKNVNIKYMSYLLERYLFSNSGAIIPQLTKPNIQNIKIPLPPLDIQKKIVAEIEKIEKAEVKAGDKIIQLESDIINIFNSQNDNLKMKLGEVVNINAGQSPKSEFYNRNGEGLSFYQGKLDFTDKYIKPPRMWTTQVKKTAYLGDILISVRAPVGDVNICSEKEICIGRGLFALKANENKILQEFLWHYLKFNKENIENLAKEGLSFKSITKPEMENLKIPVPSIEEQKAILDKITPLENEIDKLKTKLSKAPKQKDDILNKFLQ